MGFDVHRLAPGRKLIIGGVDIPHPMGLLGHSDADVLTHAICDALLGALALGDIGQSFPDSDTRYKDISSLELLTQVARMLVEKGYAVMNVDCSIAAEAPKLSPHYLAMRENVASAIGVDIGAVSIKATTTEGLGYTGRGEGIAAWAVAMLERSGNE
jgi:2-C-methyl-D-erythritol 2,4-cyclodiphosphate synthase